MDTFSEDFKTWMDGHGLNAESLAPIIGKSPGTISQWRSRGVPERPSVRDFLTAFMRDYKPTSAQLEQSETRLAIPFTDEEFELVERAAQLTETGTVAFVRNAATARAEEDITKEKAQSSYSTTTSYLHSLNKVAEDETPYRVNTPKGK